MTTDDELKHIGVKRRSGRYPWGSGNDPEQRGTSFLGTVEQLHKQGLSEVEIARGLGIKTSGLRSQKTIDLAAKKAADAAFAYRLREKGMSKSAISKRMGINDHTVASLLNPSTQARNASLKNISDVLKTCADESPYGIDVGAHVENHLGVTNTKLKVAIKMLEDQGYKIQYHDVIQSGTGKKTSLKYLVKPGTDWKDVEANKEKVQLPGAHSQDYGVTLTPLEPVRHIDSKRIEVRYAEDGGSLKDGVIELRKGVPELALSTHYAQVRIGVDGTHFMKGMAIYTDNIPEGKDIIYNTNKPKGSSKDLIFKPVKKDKLTKVVDETNPFNASITQRHYIDADGKEQLSALNLVGQGTHINEEGAWSNWSKSLSSQILSKQLPEVAKKQLGEALTEKQKSFEELQSLTNPVVKRVLLQKFASECDSGAVDLKAAALPRQSSHVLLPVVSLKENEVFAPNFENGESVVLIRHPHGGPFEIPELIVNNKNQEALSVYGKDAKDMVGINPKVAGKLSGADFDGDAVIVIPNANKNIRTESSLRGLKGFSTTEAYPEYPGMPKMSPKTKQTEMGNISNLITDMTIKGASDDELAAAVRHSMVVIDAEKHNLNYKQSALDNNISSLKLKYQGKTTGGAATLISRAGSDFRVPLRKDQVLTDPTTGKKVYQYITGETYINAKGHKVKVTTPDINIAKASPGEIYVTQKYKKDPVTGKKIYLEGQYKSIKRETKTTKMAQTEDARTLIGSTNTRMEVIYADHANALKDLGNKARLLYLNTPGLSYSPSAAKTYSNEVKSLDSKLNEAFKNAPLERHAQTISDKKIKTKMQSNPDMEPDQIKKLRGRSLIEARTLAGAGKKPVEITDREWEAIQAGAISNNKLVQILNNTNVDALKQRALPHSTVTISDASASRARQMHDSGQSRAEIASTLGVSLSTVDKILA
jgi:DNA-binding CsgD family transcriptional regulator